MPDLKQILKTASANLEKVHLKERELHTEVETVEKRVCELSEIVRAVEGLDETRKRLEEDKSKRPYANYDPGKYGPAYFFVKRIINGEGRSEIVASKNFEPVVFKNCPSCGEKTPLLMSYEQTEDTVDGDLWEAHAFIICCEKIHTIARTGSEYRFLHAE
jgi:hypothetical protein